MLRAECEAGRVTGLYTRNHGDIPLRAQQVVLASGSFFSNGLVADFDGVREPIFGLDVHSRADRADWSRRELFAPQPYLQFGVRTDGRLRAMKQECRSTICMPSARSPAATIRCSRVAALACH